jgi:sugar lactone lactonase YvrE
MNTKIGGFLLLAFCAIGYLLFWPVSVNPVAWEAPKNSGLTRKFSPNTALSHLEFYSLDGQTGPEDLAIDSFGNIAVSLHSGAIMRLQKNANAFQLWVNTEGRPLGIEFDKDDNLIVADAYRGLLSIAPSGKISVLATTADGLDIVYADDLDIADNGLIYFSDASTKFGAQQFGGTLAASMLDILEHGGQGRLLVYDPNTTETHTLLDELNFANGVSLNHDQTSVLVIETGSYRVIQYWLKGKKKGKFDVLIDNLPGFPDNISQSLDGHYWLGLASPRSSALDALSTYPFLRKIIQRLPAILRPKPQHYGHVIKINSHGEVLQSLQDPSGRYPMTTGVLETYDSLFISSLTTSSLARKIK